MLGRYEILSHLATGGMADVWLARASGAGGFSKIVALKTLLPAYAANNEFTAMLIHEASIAAKLSHPGIVQIFDLGSNGGQYFIAMEHVLGHTLRHALQRAKRAGVTIPAPVALAVILECCEALAYAHDFCDERGKPLNLVHRDVSPENIMVTALGHAKVLDFGIASSKSVGSDTSRLKGKFAYMAPECFRGETPERRRDVYALAVVLYELLAGHRPIDSRTDAELVYRINHEDAPPICQFRPDLPDVLEETLARALSRDAAERPATAAIFASELRLCGLEVGLESAEVAAFFRGLLGDPPALLVPSSSPSPSSDDDELPMLSPDIEIDLSTSDIDASEAAKKEEERKPDLWTPARPVLSVVDTGDLFPAIRARSKPSFDIFGAYRRRR